MRIPDRFGDWWRLIATPNSTWIEVPRSAADRSLAVTRLRTLPAGSPVVVSAAGVGSKRRTRSFARAAELTVDAEYLAYPALSAPAFLVRQGRRPLRYFWSTLAAVPPGTARHAAALDLAIALLRRLPPVIQGQTARGRLLVGRRQ